MCGDEAIAPERIAVKGLAAASSAMRILIAACAGCKQSAAGLLVNAGHPLMSEHIYNPKNSTMKAEAEKKAKKTIVLAS